MTRWTIGILAFVAAACTESKTAARSTQVDAARVERVTNGLRPQFAIAGEPPTRWTLADRMRHYHVPGISIAVIDSGKIVWAKGFGVKDATGADSATPETIFQAGSISKPTFALGVMRLVQDGKLDLDENVNVKLTSWKLPENAFTATEKVTLRRILSHTAGLTVHGFPGYEAGVPVPTVPQVLNGEKPANTAPVRVDTTPGAISRYSGGGTTVAMLLVTDVTHQPFADFMQDNVLGPAGMVHSTYQQPLPSSRIADAASGHEVDGSVVKGKYHTYPEQSAAGLWTTPSDLATLGIELQHTYLGQDTGKVVSRATLKQMLTVQKAPFGIGYVVNGAGPDLEFSHNGDDAGFVASFIVFAERGQGVAIMTNGENGGSLMDEIVPSIAEEYGWHRHLQETKNAIAVDSKSAAQLAGRYRFRAGGMAQMVDTVTVEHGKLFMASGSSMSKVELLADTDTTFFTRDGAVPVVFNRDKTHRVVGLTIGGMGTGQKMR